MALISKLRRPALSREIRESPGECLSTSNKEEAPAETKEAEKLSKQMPAFLKYKRKNCKVK